MDTWTMEKSLVTRNSTEKSHSGFFNSSLPYYTRRKSAKQSVAQVDRNF